jgi:hypothetical protein
MPVSFPLSIGWLIALIVLIVCIVIALTDTALTINRTLALIGALAVARLIP